MSFTMKEFTQNSAIVTTLGLGDWFILLTPLWVIIISALVLLSEEFIK